MTRAKQDRKTYLVGGAVRDSLLGLKIIERDWVVVGGTPAALLAEGYLQVGKDFPVYLHPSSKEEYALARTERKVNAGHKGFECDAGEDITLEEDLLRRDLTINAIAQEDDGTLIDPYNGAIDLEQRLLRHVSSAFEEDPLRILRVARFLARFGTFNFHVAEETSALCRKMVARGELEELPAERIFQELDKALSTDHPALFFKFLDEISAGASLWPDLNSDDFDRLQKATTLKGNAQRFAVLLSQSSRQAIETVCSNLKAPRSYSELALLCHDYLDSWVRLPELRAEQIVSILYKASAYRKTDQFLDLGLVCDTIGSWNPSYDSQLDNWKVNLSIASGITSSMVDASLKGPAIGAAIRKRQVEAIETRIEDQKKNHLKKNPDHEN
jgi:tRNA nucleotidyltransferase (CCA-adding enzyme)